MQKGQIEKEMRKRKQFSLTHTVFVTSSESPQLFVLHISSFNIWGKCIDLLASFSINLITLKIFNFRDVITLTPVDVLGKLNEQNASLFSLLYF